MENILIGLVIGFAGAVGLWWVLRRGKAPSGPTVQVHSSIESMRDVGELTVFRMQTKEIVTAADHWLGNWGKRYMKWLISEKKMALIFEFAIDFKFDLRSSSFVIRETSPGAYELSMPDCFYTTSILDISFYDEQNSRLLPWLVPDLVNRAFGSGFDENDRNKLKAEARAEADRMATNMVEGLQPDVQKSARQTLVTLARAFGARNVDITFKEAVPVLAKLPERQQQDEAALGESA